MNFKFILKTFLIFFHGPDEEQDLNPPLVLSGSGPNLHLSAASHELKLETANVREVISSSSADEDSLMNQ